MKSLLHRLLTLPLVTLACATVVRSADDDGPPIGPAAGTYQTKFHDPLNGALEKQTVQIELPNDFRITHYKRIKVVIRAEDLMILEAKPAHEKKLRAALAEPSRLEEEFFAGVLSSGPQWLSPMKPGADAGSLTTELHLERIDCGKAMHTYIFVALPVILPVPIKQSFGMLSFELRVLDGGKPLLRFQGVTALNLSDPGPKAAMRNAVRSVGDWLGQLFRSVWKGERLATAAMPPIPPSSEIPSATRVPLAPAPADSAPATAPVKLESAPDQK